MKSELLRGNVSYKFRYQNGSFENIGFTKDVSDGHSSMYLTDFNLSTGVHVYKRENYETGRVITNEKKIVKIRPLPKLQYFNPDHVIYE